MNIDSTTESQSVGEGLTVGQTLSMLRQGAVLVDVRTPSEFRAGHAFCAVNIQLGWLATDIPVEYPDRTIVTICSYGNRSSRAAADLVSDGIRAFFVAGGLASWRQAGERVVLSPVKN